MSHGFDRVGGILLAFAATSAGAFLHAPVPAQTAPEPEQGGNAPARGCPPESAAPVVPSVSAAPRLRLDIERHVRCVDLEPARDLPRFEETVDVEGRTAEALLARFLEPQGLLRGATPGGAPGVEEMREYRPGPTPGLDLLPALQLLGRALGLGKPGGGKPVTGSFFLYRVRTASGDWPLVRDGRLPPESLGAVAGVSFELLGEYPDWNKALAAYRRLDAERGAAAARVEPPRPAPTP